MAQRLRTCLPIQETKAQSLGQEDALGKEMAAHSSIIVWKIPWTEELGGLQPMESQESETVTKQHSSPKALETARPGWGSETLYF